MPLFRYTRFGREHGPRIEASLSGAVTGAILGGLAGLGVCAWWLTGPPPLFPGDTILGGALLVGWIGWRWGKPAVARVRDEFLTWWV
ncbi:hypothetical protein [Alienimonas sp. DA493]|uniref:hypothetical protein n=1 Tax=Alienimonas sp. DA493 TaxID=3373605 RepID=UPI003754A20F